ncbi:MAG: hypothetical protein PHH11_10300, partial [Methylomonas sp.]|nr:hypothetical protein [Methylomonas sp.]
ESQASSKALEKELASVRKALDTASKAKDTAQEQVKQIELDNARLSERVAHAEGRAGDLKEELDKLHSRLQEITAKKEPKTKPQKE